MVNYVSPKIDYKTLKKSVVIPDQSLSVQEIVKRYVRGVPVDVIQRERVYIDQNEFDLEKLSRMDFAEKLEYASALADKAKRLKSELDEHERSSSEAMAKKASDKAAKAAAKFDEAVKQALGAAGGKA